MPKLAPKSANDVIKVLEANGFKRISGSAKGSHIRFGRTNENGYRATTVQCNRKAMTVWVLHKIIRQTGKPVEEFY